VIDTVPMDDILRYTAEKLSRPENVSISIDISEVLLPARIDAGQIQRVIGHILANAVEAMPDGGEVRIVADNFSIESRHEMPVKAGRYLRITISDRGIGIPPENLPRVFDPYYTTKTTYAEKGMGLGLSLAYSIIKRHHGHITIDSAVNAGTTVVLYLPAAE